MLTSNNYTFYLVVVRMFCMQNSDKVKKNKVIFSLVLIYASISTPISVQSKRILPLLDSASLAIKEDLIFHNYTKLENA